MPGVLKAATSGKRAWPMPKQTTPYLPIACLGTHTTGRGARPVPLRRARGPGLRRHARLIITSRPRLPGVPVRRPPDAAAAEQRAPEDVGGGE